jgi:hypothetical protein
LGITDTEIFRVEGHNNSFLTFIVKRNESKKKSLFFFQPTRPRVSVDGRDWIENGEFIADVALG